jgi:hypothetical protein
LRRRDQLDFQLTLKPLIVLLLRKYSFAGFQDVIGVLVVSAIPFVAVQALADSKYGKELQVGFQPLRIIVAIYCAMHVQELREAVKAMRLRLHRTSALERQHVLAQANVERQKGRLKAEAAQKKREQTKAREDRLVLFNA